jgi:hypothetical protein
LPSCFGFDAIHFQIGGREFVQPEYVRDFSRADMDALWTFRDQLDPQQPLFQRVSQLGYVPEQWDILDASINGYGLFRLRRGSSASRIEYGQLCCVKPMDSEYFLLGKISWLMLKSDGSLRAGLYLLPGRPRAICARTAGPGATSGEKYIRALQLPAVAGLREPESIIMPRGCFSAERKVELLTDRQQTIRLGQCLEIGADFERFSYVPD